MNGQRQVLPLRMGTRQRRQKVGVVAATTSQASTPLVFPRVGLLSNVIVQMRGTVTLAAAGALADLGPWSLLNRAKLTLNVNSATIFDLSGFGGFLVQPWISKSFRPNAGGAGSTTPSTDIHSTPVAMGANSWVLTWVFPVALNRGRNFEVGLINLQAPEVQVTLDLSTGAGADYVTQFTSLTNANYHVYQEYYEIPDPARFALPPLALARTLEESQAISAVGDNIYTVPRQGTLMQMAHLVRLNGARSDSFDSTSIRFNKTDSPYVEERQAKRVYERAQYDLDPITGVAYHDFFHADELVSSGDSRDAIDTEEISVLESVVTINSGAGLGANNNFLGTVRRIVQVLEG